MNNFRKWQLGGLALAGVLLMAFGISISCSAAKLTKATGEVLDGELVGIIVWQAERSDTETGPAAYLLCAGKHVSSISQRGISCDENARVLLKVTEKPVGQAQMAVLEDAAYQIGHIKDRELRMFVVPNGTKAIAMKPASSFDAASFRLLGILELRNGLATLCTNLVLKKSKDKIYVPVKEIDPASPVGQLQLDHRVALLASAKTVFVMATGEKAPSGAGGFLTKMATKKYTYADAESAKKDVSNEVNKAKRWILVNAAENADLVLLIDETNSSMGMHIIDRLAVFEGGSVPERSTTQPLWFSRQEEQYRSASALGKGLEEDMRVVTELQSEKTAAVMPPDIDIADTSAKSTTQATAPSPAAAPTTTQSSASDASVESRSESLPVVGKEILPVPTAAPEHKGPPADVKGYLLSSTTIFVRGELGPVERATRAYLNPNAERARNKVTKILNKWGRYQVVDDPAHADLIAVVTESNRVIMGGLQEQLRSNLSVYAVGFDSHDAKPLWAGDAKEALTKMPSTKVAEDFRKYVDELRK